MVREVLRSRRSSIFFMVGVLVIAGLLAVKVIFFPEQSRESAAPSASASASPSLSAVAASAGSVGADGRAVCDVPVPAGKEFSAEVPEDYVWEQTPSGVHYPVSATYGPTVRQGRMGQCFAHNPTGAAMAAINALTVAGNQEIPAADRRAIFSSRYAGKPDPWEGEDEDVSSDVSAMVYGFGIQGYSTERATVKVYTLAQSNTGETVSAWMPVRMVWENGDWRFDSEKSEVVLEVVSDDSQKPAQRFTVDPATLKEWGFKL
ncbi:hypothetical protein [uncultured Rothia sp.]|uniref:hypothetical protein n=1 Tax=uncultured Rothia sp. TaxID=316088 RepID=UPI002635A006|nr:hypothetical protein [uncultured Rothia sp.]